MDKRKELLDKLLNFNVSLDLINRLNELSWDSPELIQVEDKHLIKILNLYIDDKIFDDEIEEWSNIVECRDDIGYKDDSLKEIIYELANPLLTRPLTKNRAKEILNYLLNKNNK